MLSWIICGGESGPNARLMQPDWVRVFFKQWGKWDPVLEFVDKKRAGHLLDGQDYHEFPGIG